MFSKHLVLMPYPAWSIPNNYAKFFFFYWAMLTLDGDVLWWYSVTSTWSPNLSLCDFLVWGYLGSSDYEVKLHALNKLKKINSQMISGINRDLPVLWKQWRQFSEMTSNINDKGERISHAKCNFRFMNILNILFSFICYSTDNFLKQKLVIVLLF